MADEGFPQPSAPGRVPVLSDGILSFVSVCMFMEVSNADQPVRCGLRTLGKITSISLFVKLGMSGTQADLSSGPWRHRDRDKGRNAREH
jgi:hypothetical protein